MASNMRKEERQNLAPKNGKASSMGAILRILMAVFVMFVLITPFNKQASAGHYCPYCICSAIAYSLMVNAVLEEHAKTKYEVFGTSGETCERCGTQRMGQHEDWLIDTLFLPRLLPAMMMMTEQFSAVMEQQIMIIGALMDAKIQLDTQRLFWQMTAEAHKDYHPSVGMCTFGTTIRSLSNAERRGDVMMAVMSQRSKQRQLGKSHTI